MLPEIYKSKLPTWLQNIKLDTMTVSVDNNIETYPNYETRMYNHVSLGQDKTVETQITDMNTNKKYFVNFYQRYIDPNLIEVEIIPFSEYGLD